LDLRLSNFRNFSKRFFEFSNRVTVILGDNATGKSNILEAICLIATGKSFKARVESEMIAYSKQISRISAHIKADGLLNLEAVITNGEVQIGDSPVNIKKTRHKKLLVNGVPKRLIDFAGNLKVVLFGPWDMDLVTQSPSLRRRFMDGVLSQVDREYRRSVLIYEKGLRQRNKLLLRIRDENVSRGQLLYWDKLLIKHGEYITKRREDLISFINKNKNHTINDQFIGEYLLEYDNSIISEGRLKNYEEEEIAAATTLVGPHRDDFQFTIFNFKLSNKRNLTTYGSRGEQRMGVLWLKLAELAFIESETQEKPVLLLDDIFSELDHEHRSVVMRICSQQQTIITTADPHNVEGLKGKLINL